VALKSLGKVGEEAGPVFAKAEPVVRKASNLAQSGVVPTKELSALFGSLEETKGWQRLTELIYNSAGAFNGFDKYGHFGRALVTLSNCLNYEPAPLGASGCDANFNGENASVAGEATASVVKRLFSLLKEGKTLKEAEESEAGEGSEAPATGLGTARSTEGFAPQERAEGEAEPGLGEATPTEGTEPLLDYLLGQ
jgi:hypothetical protein